MLTTDDYLAFCDRAFDAMSAIVAELGGDLANRRPDLPGANSAYAILTHCLGMAARWSSTVNRGVVIPRDRDAEFAAAGPVGELLSRAATARESFRRDVRASDPTAAPANPPAEASFFTHSQGAVLMHVYEELAQHLGQMELTRDAVRAALA